ncbi:hypothetical protein V6N13_046560 [Hibiscus sabdariffa]
MTCRIEENIYSKSKSSGLSLKRVLSRIASSSRSIKRIRSCHVGHQHASALPRSNTDCVGLSYWGHVSLNSNNEGKSYRRCRSRFQISASDC